MNLIGKELKEKFNIGDIVLTNPFDDDYLGIILNITEIKLGNRLLPSAKIFLLKEKEIKEFLLEVLRLKEKKNEKF
tara:strand:- start:643 stop:870 length:228 start_codon:yes stop_codon:yes gene_type:complete